jgi:hypothetical protein
VSLGDATDGRVAGHLGDQICIQSYESGPEAHTGGGHRGLAAGMACADHNHVVMFGVLHIWNYSPVDALRHRNFAGCRGFEEIVGTSITANTHK